VPAVPVLEGGDDPATWLLMRQIDGVSPCRNDLDDAEALASLTREVAAVMAKAHAVNGSGVAGARPLGPNLAAYLEASVAALTAAGYQPPGRWREAALLYERGPATLLHGDLGLGNLLRDRDGRLWLLDASAYRGHAAFDAARWCARVAGPDRVEAALAAWLESEPAVDTAHTRALLGLELLLQAGVREAVKRQRGREDDGREDDGRDAATASFLSQARRYLAGT
jgi:aminoglycoside phosphotransferase (APT) family kinase protein